MNATLQTVRLILRPIQNGDEDILWPATADPEISRFMAWEAHTMHDQTAAFVKNEVERWNVQRGITWIILHKNSFCGLISLIGLLYKHRSLRYNKAELAYWLLPLMQNKGFMTEAAIAVMYFAFNELDLHKICVSHFGENEDSRRLINRLRFRYIGKQIAEFQKNGAWHDHSLYEMLAEEFRKLHTGD